MKLAIALLTVAPAFAQSWDILALGAAHTADAVVSWGHKEANPVMGQRFGARGVTITVASFATTVALEKFVEHRDKRARKWTRIVNYGLAAALSGLAIRNHFLVRNQHGSRGSYYHQ